MKNCISPIIKIPIFTLILIQLIFITKQEKRNDFSVLKLSYNQAQGDETMEYESIIQSVLDEIDKRITEDIHADEFARRANYSTYHFRRVFIELTGIPFMSYITRRKLEYALYDLSQGKKIIDVAMDYGFETHAGFTKAFKKHYAYPPSLYRLRIVASKPTKATIHNIKIKYGWSDALHPAGSCNQGGIKMQVEIGMMENVVQKFVYPYVNASDKKLRLVSYSTGRSFFDC